MLLGITVSKIRFGHAVLKRILQAICVTVWNCTCDMPTYSTVYYHTDKKVTVNLRHKLICNFALLRKMSISNHLLLSIYRSEYQNSRLNIVFTFDNSLWSA